MAKNRVETCIKIFNIGHSFSFSCFYELFSINTVNLENFFICIRLSWCIVLPCLLLCYLKITIFAKYLLKFFCHMMLLLDFQVCFYQTWNFVYKISSSSLYLTWTWVSSCTWEFQVKLEISSWTSIFQVWLENLKLNLRFQVQVK